MLLKERQRGERLWIVMFRQIAHSRSLSRNTKDAPQNTSTEGVAASGRAASQNSASGGMPSRLINQIHFKTGHAMHEVQHENCSRLKTDTRSNRVANRARRLSLSLRIGSGPRLCRRRGFASGNSAGGYRFMP